MSRTVNIPIPVRHAEQVSRALEELERACPRHHDGERKLLVAIDECQWHLLEILKKAVHGDAQIEFAEGRPTVLLLRQSFKFGKDGLEKIEWLDERGNGPGEKVIAFDRMK